jgi:hypothetical protein
MDWEEIIKRLAGMDEADKDKLWEDLQKNNSVAGAKLAPTPGPQWEAFNSKADILLYGGMAGGGKSALLILLALLSHSRSLLMRRQYTDLGALIEDCLDKHGSRKGFSGAPPAKLRVNKDRLLEFGAAKQPGDEDHWRGQPHDFLGIDEASQWLEQQVRFLMSWVRSADPKQACRVVLATNPPENPAQGQWLITMFAPWLDPAHDLYPTPDGTLRWVITDEEGNDKWVDGWVITDEEGNDKWVDGPEDVMVGNRKVKPKSRTFIRASLADNPFLADTGYKETLDATPEPLRSAIRDGNWMISHEDDPFQLIPTNWVMQAQERWTREPPDGSPMCSIGVDVAQGGSNETVLAMRYDYWFDDLVAVPGHKTPSGSDVAALVLKHRQHNAEVIIDMGGGYGEGPYSKSPPLAPRTGSGGSIIRGPRRGGASGRPLIQISLMAALLCCRLWIASSSVTWWLRGSRSTLGASRWRARKRSRPG